MTEEVNPAQQEADLDYANASEDQIADDLANVMEDEEEEKAESEPETNEDEGDTKQELEAEESGLEEDPEERGQEDAEEEELIEVTLSGGKKAELSLSELKELASKGDDYTNKTMQLAEQRRGLEMQVRQEQIAERQSVIEKLQNFANVIEQMVVGDEAELKNLRELDFEAYQIKKEEVEDKRNKLNEVYTQQQYQQQQLQMQQVQQYEALKQDNLIKMQELLPEYLDQKTGAEKQAELANYLVNQGIDKEVVTNLVDANHILLAHKAMMYDKLQEAQKTVKQNKKVVKFKSQKPGKKVGAVASGNQDKALGKRAKTSGRTEDYAAWLEQSLN